MNEVKMSYNNFTLIHDDFILNKSSFPFPCGRGGVRFLISSDLLTTKKQVVRL